MILTPVDLELSVLSPGLAMLSADVNLVSSPIQTLSLDASLSVSLTLIASKDIFVRVRNVLLNLILVILHPVVLEQSVL